MNSPLRRGLRYAKPYSLYLVISFISAIVYVLATLVTPILIGYAIDELDPLKATIDTNQILFYIITIIVIIVVGAIFGYLMNYFISKITYYTVRDLRKEAFKKLLNVPVSTLDTHSHGDIIGRIITDVDVVQDGLLQSFTEAFTGIITIIVTLAFMLVLNYKIGLIVVALTPLSLIVAMIIAKLSFKTIRKTSEVKGNLSSFVNEMIENQKVVIAYNHQEENQEYFRAIDKELYKHGVNAQFYSSLTNPATRFVNAIIYMVVATVGAIIIVGNPDSLSVGMLNAFLSYASQYTKPFNSISSVWAELQNSIASLRRIFEWLDEDEYVEKSVDVIENLDGAITFNDVCFGYSKEKRIIDSFTLDVKPGEKIAIVGPTGCGKTTLINLLMRFYDINSGDICIDSENINKIKVSSLRANIGMVLQDTWLFNGTIRDNIAYGKDNATMDEIIDAAKRAYAHDFIMRLKDGYDTVVSSEGSMSIGQKQLLCIARLMLRLPNILILDEATSNIDTRTEIKVAKAFNDMMEGRTSFIIAHRLSTIKSADKIVVLNNGRIMEIGTHEALLASGGFYKQIYDAQFQTK